MGWELPEAQPGEKLSGQAVLNTVANIVTKFQRIENRLPRRVLLLRDGLVQCDEFEETIYNLQQNNIAVDLLGVRKSGAGRMAIKNEFGELIDAVPGTAILAKNGNVFRIVTSKAKAGGSARPLQIFRDYGNAPLEVLAQQVDRLCMLNPASGFFSQSPSLRNPFCGQNGKRSSTFGRGRSFTKSRSKQNFLCLIHLDIIPNLSIEKLDGVQLDRAFLL